MDKSLRMYALLDRQASSNLSIKEFCAAEGISYATLHYWRGKRRREQTKPTAPPPPADFIPLRCSGVTPPDTPGLRIELPGGLVLGLTAGDPALLADLLHHLDRRCAQL